MYRLALLEGGLQDLAADQGGHFVGLDGLNGTGARHRHRHILHGGRVGQIGAADDLLARTHTAGEQNGNDHHNHYQSDHPLDPLALLFGRLKFREFFLILLGRRCGFRFYLGCFHGRFSFSLLSPAGHSLFCSYAPL